jgi:4-hydroxybenzoate polyprenyltransferase
MEDFRIKDVFIAMTRKDNPYQIMNCMVSYTMAKFFLAARDEKFGLDYPSMLLFINIFVHQAASMLIADCIDRDFDKAILNRRDRPIPSGKVRLKEAIVALVILYSLTIYTTYLIPYMTIWMQIKVNITYLMYITAKYYFPDPQLLLLGMNVYENIVISDGSLYHWCIVLFLWCPYYVLQVLHSGANARERARLVNTAVKLYQGKLKYVTLTAYIVGLLCGLYVVYERPLFWNYILIIHYILLSIRHQYHIMTSCKEFEEGKVDCLPYSAEEHFLLFMLKSVFLY